MSGATDIAASALLSGGKPNLSNIPKALTGASSILKGEGLNLADKIALKAGLGLSEAGANLVNNRQAFTKIAMSALVNPAINTGLDYATTGQLPSGRDLLAQVGGGALFSEANALGRMVHGAEPAGEPLAKTDVEEGVGKPEAEKILSPFLQTNPEADDYIS